MSSTRFTEKRGGEWFYAIRGQAARHGLVDEPTLYRMATEGRLQRDDLIWHKVRGDRWARADSLAGLFPERPAPVDDAASTPAPVLVSPRHRTTLPLLLIMGVILVATASWISQKLYLHEIKPSPGLMRLFGIDTFKMSVHSFDTQARLIDLYLGREDAVRAEALINELSRNEATRAQALAYRRRLAELQTDLARRRALGEHYDAAVAALDDGRLAEAEAHLLHLRDAAMFKEQAAALSRRLQAMKGVYERKQAFRTRLRTGDIHRGNAHALIEVYHQNRELHELYSDIEDALRQRQTLPARMTLSAAHVYLALEQPTHARVALNYFLDAADRSGPETDYLAAAQVCEALGDPEKAIATLSDYLAQNPDKVMARFELAALQARGDDRRTALANLRQAIRHGGDAVRQKAAADVRFDSVRETWTFRRLVRM